MPAENRPIAWIIPRRLGDALFQTPAMRFLAECRPELRIDVVAITQVSATVLEHAPYVHRVMVCLSDDAFKCLRGQYSRVVLGMPGQTGSRLAGLMGGEMLTLSGGGPGRHVAERGVSG